MFSRSHRRSRQRERCTDCAQPPTREGDPRGPQCLHAFRKAAGVREAFVAGALARRSPDARAVDRHAHGRERREDGEGSSHRARGAGRLRPPQPRACCESVGRRDLRRRGHAGDTPPGVRSTDHGRQRDPSRLDARVVLEAPASLRPRARHGHGRKFIAADRRRERLALDDRIEGQGARLRAPRLPSNRGRTRRWTPEGGCSWVRRMPPRQRSTPRASS